MTLLQNQHCAPVLGRGAMAEAECGPLLTQLSGWSVQDGALLKRYQFADFHRTMAFVNAVAELAHAQDHHPDLTVSYAHCTVRWSTHSVGGLSINDFICAAQVDAVAI